MINIAVSLSVFLVLDYSLTYVGQKAISRMFQKSWEEDFLRRHHDFIRNHPDNSSNDYIELTIKNRSEDNLALLCRQYYSEWTTNRCINKYIERFDPKIETTNYIGFRRIKEPSKPEPVRVEIVRCNKKYALIANEEEENPLKNIAYALKRAKQQNGLNGEIFFINWEYRVEEEIPHSEADQKNFENEFLARNRDYLEQNKDNLQNLTMPSNFDAEEISHFSFLCQKFTRLWPFVRKAEPGLEPLYVDFQYVDSNPGPVRVVMLKCAKKYAIMIAEKNVSIYLLTKGKHVESLQTKVFNIFSKVPYRNRNVPPPVMLPIIDNTPASRSSDKSEDDSDEPTTSIQKVHYPDLKD